MRQVLHPRIVLLLAEQVGELYLLEKVLDLLVGAHPPMPYNLIVGLDRISSTIAEYIELSETVLRETKSTQGPSRFPPLVYGTRPPSTPLGLTESFRSNLHWSEHC